jgi:hypothetical protein
MTLSKSGILVFVYLFAGLGIEPRALGVQGKSSVPGQQFLPPPSHQVFDIWVVDIT